MQVEKIKKKQKSGQIVRSLTSAFALTVLLATPSSSATPRKDNETAYTGRESLRVIFFDKSIGKSYEYLANKKDDMIYFFPHPRIHRNEVTLRAEVKLPQNISCDEFAQTYWDDIAYNLRAKIGQAGYRCFSASEKIYTGNGLCKTGEGCNALESGQILAP